MDMATSNVIVAATALVNTLLSVVTLLFINHVRHQTNSIKDELVAATRSDATQTGITEGRALQRAETEGKT